MERNIINPKRIDEWYSSLTINELEAVFGEEFDTDSPLSFEDWCDSRWGSLTVKEKTDLYRRWSGCGDVVVQSCVLTDGQRTPAVVRVSVQKGIGIHVIGLADTKTRESLLRVTTALSSCGYRIPGKKVIISIAHALGAATESLDLAIAVALAACNEGCRINAEALEGTVIAGELGLDGSVRNNIGELQASTLTQAVTMLEKHQVQP